MSPTIKYGETFLADMSYYKTKSTSSDSNEPKRGEIIVYKHPEPGTDVLYYKRVIGVPGDIIETKDGFLTVNNQALKTSLKDSEAYKKISLLGGTYQEINHQGISYSVRRIPSHKRLHHLGRKRFVLRAKEYFVVGDNRDETADSRNSGVVPLKNIYGRVVI